MQHTILGAGGSIGNALTYELLQTNEDIRLVSRSGFSIKGTNSVKADLTSYKQTLKSVEGSDIVYLLVGLEYKHKVWAELWPKIMENTIKACKSAGAKLIFFDNVYMYGKVDGKMTEETPVNPCSKKGKVRAQIAQMLIDEFEKSDLDVSIARAADLYGPHATKTSVPYILALSKLMKGKSAQWMADDKTVHTFTYTIDCAKAMMLMANDDKSFNQIWHLPSYNPPINGKEFIEIAAKEIGVKPKYSVLKPWMVKLAGIFDKNISEL
ncbi:MAG: NAD-dependent dehydratase, partial [Marinilabiliales bacterium]